MEDLKSDRLYAFSTEHYVSLRGYGAWSDSQFDRAEVQALVPWLQAWLKETEPK